MGKALNKWIDCPVCILCQWKFIGYLLRNDGVSNIGKNLRC